MSTMYNFKKTLAPLCDNRHKFKYGSWLRRPNFCKTASEYRAYKKVLRQFLVYGIGDPSGFWMMPNRSLMNLKYPLDYLDLFGFIQNPQSNSPKIQQTMMLVTCQRFGDLFLFGLVWQYSSVPTKYNKGRFKVMATYLKQ